MNVHLTFPNTESPLTDGGGGAGTLTNTVSGTWTNPVKATSGSPGFGYGPVASSTNDAIAMLTGSWGSTQTLTITMSLNGTDTASECEGHVRMNMTGGNNVTGYEYDFVPSSHTTIVARWNGTQGSFTVIGDYGNTDPQNDGDIWIYGPVSGTGASIVLPAQKNGVGLTTLNDTDGSGINTGSPGIGFDNEAGAGDGTNCWRIKDYVADDGAAVILSLIDPAILI